MNNTLLPCPFCGGDARIKSRYIGYGSVGLGARDWYTVECNECRAKSDEYGAELEAITAWNRRAKPENKPLTLDELLRMKGEPVWVSDIDPFSQDKCSCWAIVGDAEEAGIELYDKFCDKNYIDFGASELYGKTWLAYRAKPKEEVL